MGFAKSLGKNSSAGELMYDSLYDESPI
jgi:hypothetical protein